MDSFRNEGVDASQQQPTERGYFGCPGGLSFSENELGSQSDYFSNELAFWRAAQKAYPRVESGAQNVE